MADTSVPLALRPQPICFSVVTTDSSGHSPGIPTSIGGLSPWTQVLPGSVGKAMFLVTALN